LNGLRLDSRRMARGWESKAIEDQQAEKERAALEAHRVQLSPVAIARQQRVEALRLSRSQLQNQLDLARNEMHRQMLLRSLQALETELAQLEKE
jgi:hypothetical protein